MAASKGYVESLLQPLPLLIRKPVIDACRYLIDALSQPVDLSTGVSGTLPGTQGGGLVLVSNQTASMTASLNVTTLSDDYDDYLVEMVGLLPATNGVAAQVLFSLDGASYSTAALYDYAGTYVNDAATGGTIGAVNQQAFSLTGSTNVSNTAGGGLVGSFRLMNPRSTIRHKSLIGQIWVGLTDLRSYNISESCVFKSLSAIQAFQFKYSAGLIGSGALRVYGITRQ